MFLSKDMSIFMIGGFLVVAILDWWYHCFTHTWKPHNRHQNHPSTIISIKSYMHFLFTTGPHGGHFGKWPFSHLCYEFRNSGIPSSRFMKLVVSHTQINCQPLCLQRCIRVSMAGPGLHRKNSKTSPFQIKIYGGFFNIKMCFNFQNEHGHRPQKIHFLNVFFRLLRRTNSINHVPFFWRISIRPSCVDRLSVAW